MPASTNLLQDNHPNIRKAHRIERLIKMGEKDGRLVNPSEMMRKFDELLSKPFKPYALRPTSSYLRKHRNGLGKTQLPKVGVAVRTVQLHGKGYNNFHISSGQAFIGL